MIEQPKKKPKGALGILVLISVLLGVLLCLALKDMMAFGIIDVHSILTNIDQQMINILNQISNYFG